MNQTEIIQALEDYMHASLEVNGEITRRAKQAIEALKANCSEKPNNSPAEMSGTFNNDLAMAKALADVLTNPVIVCDKLLGTGWCKEHCKPETPDAECWLRYAEVIASD